jgi:hypothetical protein
MGARDLIATYGLGAAPRLYNQREILSIEKCQSKHVCDRFRRKSFCIVAILSTQEPLDKATRDQVLTKRLIS